MSYNLLINCPGLPILDCKLPFQRHIGLSSGSRKAPIGESSLLICPTERRHHLLLFRIQTGQWVFDALDVSDKEQINKKYEKRANMQLPLPQDQRRGMHISGATGTVIASVKTTVSILNSFYNGLGYVYLKFCLLPILFSFFKKNWGPRILSVL